MGEVVDLSFYREHKRIVNTSPKFFSHDLPYEYLNSVNLRRFYADSSLSPKEVVLAICDFLGIECFKSETSQNAYNMNTRRWGAIGHCVFSGDEFTLFDLLDGETGKYSIFTQEKSDEYSLEELFGGHVLLLARVLGSKFPASR